MNVEINKCVETLQIGSGYRLNYEKPRVDQLTAVYIDSVDQAWCHQQFWLLKLGKDADRVDTVGQ